MRRPGDPVSLLLTSFFFLAACGEDVVTEAEPVMAEEGLALTPPLGFNSWNSMEENVSDGAVLEIARAMKHSGMQEAGYTYLILDDYWAEPERDPESGRLIPHRERFPRGMKAFVEDVNALGFKVGIYSSAAELTCAQSMPGSYGHEVLDAQTFAEWGIDYLKYDYCGAPDTVDAARERYGAMGEALRSTGRPMVYAICEWGQREPWTWASEVGGHLWRTSFDMRDHWEFSPDVSRDEPAIGVLDAIDLMEPLAEYNGPGSWNDPDMMVIGIDMAGSSTAFGATGLNTTQERTMMSFWALWSSPIIHNADLRKLDPEHELYDAEWATSVSNIILNRDVLAINQDAAGKQAQRVFRDGDTDVWTKRLADGDVVIGVLNRGDEAREVQLALSDAAVADAACVTDVWQQQKLDVIDGAISVTLDAHETLLARTGC